ncbi:hypothetical protein BDR04DRAFT_1139710 [Suillus decipiens]|nr:hypothetical protein BDR04DRAFT_1139710 [Suillus decipiens]
MSGNIPTVVASVPFYISSIVIRLNDASNKKIDFAELKSDSQRQEIRYSSEQNKELSAKFDPAIAVTTERVSLFVHCQHHAIGVLPRKTTVKFSLNRNDMLSNTVNQDGQREYRSTKGEMIVVIAISALRSTSSNILQICPRFRLLVIGKTGVGKSSLVHQAFKINEYVSENNRGKADLDREFIAPKHERFLSHDSQGVESGDSDCFTIVKDFIDRRRKMPKLQDKIHLVWLCLPIPPDRGPLLESGVEEFLKFRKEILGNIPIIVVFTKHDTFIDKVELDVMELNYEKPELDDLKLDTWHILCVEPLQEIAGSDILHTTVSTKARHQETIRQLIDLTATNVEKYIASEAALAQRVDIDLKIKASIAINKKRYWRNLASGMHFMGFTMSHRLLVIHKDIIDVWNLNDPHCHLASDQFKNLISRNLDSVDFPHATNASNIALQQVMTYIADLTCIMQNLVLLAPTGPISRRVIKIIIKAYEETGKSSIHSAIQSYPSVTRSGWDHELEEIARLIKSHCIKAEAIQGLRATMDLQDDEE